MKNVWSYLLLISIFTTRCSSDSDPQQVRISLGGKNQILVSWITSDRNVESTVEYGKTPGKYENWSTGQSSSYQYLTYSSGEIHQVKIGPLEAGTLYYYRCGGAGPEFSFRTPPSLFPVEFAVVGKCPRFLCLSSIGGLRTKEWTKSTLQHVGAMPYDVFLLPGDLSYADTDQPLWDSFGSLVEPLASSRPWMVTQGNHEIETIPVLHPQSFTAYNARWVMPYEESQSTSNLYHSFDVSGAHVIMLGSYTDFDVGSNQYMWLQADLAAVDRTKTPWIFVLLHAPWYNSNLAHQGEGESMRKAMEEMLFKERVDLVLAGHVHAYERFARVYDKNANKCGPVYVTIGDGGNREGLATTFENPSPSISLYREASFGHGRLRVSNRTHAHWTWRRNNDTNSIVADEIWLRSLSSSNSCNGSD